MDEFDYELPPAAIAQTPAEPRDSARLLVRPAAGPIDHRRVVDLPELLQPGDLLVVNETRVLPARLHLQKSTGGKAEVLLLEPVGDGTWRALVRPGRRLPEGTTLRSPHDDEVEVEVAGDAGDGQRFVVVRRGGADLADVDAADELSRAGTAPLPPYITEAGDRPDAGTSARYQTVYATSPGSVAAPTAGLHLTDDIFDRLRTNGVEIARVDLVVGLDTFRPVLVDDPAEHVMHSERYSVPAETMDRCAAARRVVAVGTTTVRALESAARFGLTGRTDLFLRRGSSFEVVDLMLTNFHMPRSTLLLMIDAFIGSSWRDMYSEALAEGYRFLSFGDAMLLERSVGASIDRPLDEDPR